MASSENQGIQIALIIFVILTVVLSITTFLFFRQYDSASMERDQARTEAATANNTARSAQEEINMLKSQVIGFPEDATLTDIQNALAADMAIYAATYPDAQKTYRQVLVYLHDNTLQEARDQANKATEDNQRLILENQQREAARQAQIKQHSDAAAAAEANLRQQQTAFQATVAGLEKTKNDLQTRLDEVRAQMDQLNAESTKKIADLTGVIQNLENTLLTRTREIEEIRTETFEVPDGLIQTVNLPTGTVYINLGRADNLRRAVMFSVHDQQSNTLQGDGLKARIEVTDVLGEHLAQAKIVEDQVANPILRGDFVYSPLWHPGRKVRFAFAGVMDLDGDGKSDRQAIHDLVRVHGSEIDAEITDAGQRTGQITLETRYLVLGDQPDEGEALQGFSQLQAEARQVGTQIISFRKFLDLVGWKDSQRVLQFGKVADPTDFLKPVPDGGRRSSQGSTSDQFRRRDPRELRTAPAEEQRPQRNAAPAPM